MIRVASSRKNLTHWSVSPGMSEIVKKLVMNRLIPESTGWLVGYAGSHPVSLPGVVRSICSLVVSIPWGKRVLLLIPVADGMFVLRLNL